ncbi:glycosyl transferase [Chitinispirillum alkaliphilum]|nr:glycosyl transferase [Chitinispirillum alkaliphilum]
MRTLLIIDHAPDYREDFFRELGEKCELTVLAQPCEFDSLIAPTERCNYNYIESTPIVFGPFRWCRLPKKSFLEGFDIICSDLNLRHLWRLFLFFKFRKSSNWIWRGQIFGKHKLSFILDSVRMYFLSKTDVTLVYTRAVVARLSGKIPNTKIVSFNNTQILSSELKRTSWPTGKHPRLLYVGRTQKRKRLDRIVEMAIKYPLVEFRLVGPEMEQYIKSIKNPIPTNVQCFGRTVGKDLEQHFTWCHAVISPGILGLLVANAAKFGKPIVIEKNINHGPEYILAKESEQFFIDFNSDEDILWLIEEIECGGDNLKKAAEKLYDAASKDYTIEKMAEKHFCAFLDSLKLFRFNS